LPKHLGGKLKSFLLHFLLSSATPRAPTSDAKAHQRQTNIFELFSLQIEFIILESFHRAATTLFGARSSVCIFEQIALALLNLIHREALQTSEIVLSVGMLGAGSVTRITIIAAGEQ
jgi:hypothetical protein